MAEDWARPVVHWELEARDPERLRTFYGALFDWTIGTGPIMEIPAAPGGAQPGPAGHIRKGEQSRVSIYIQVRSLQEALDRAVELGGTVSLPPFDTPGRPTLARIRGSRRQPGDARPAVAAIGPIQGGPGPASDEFRPR